MFEPRSHYLSYGSTDQETARQAVGQYSGILVPGTIAAYQSDGTSGFVSSFVSAHPDTKYSIDPRFPLFQQALLRTEKGGTPKAKAAHRALAKLLGDEQLITGEPPSPDSFGDNRLQSLATRWHEFQTSYSVVRPSKFDKYAMRLDETKPLAHKPTPPSPLLPLYFVNLDNEPRWYEQSQRLYEHAAKLSTDYVPVIATNEALSLDRLLKNLTVGRACIWVSGFDEMLASGSELNIYATAIADAHGRGLQLFALYGGFFHVLLTTLGLRGASHGVGYGEHRVWEDLPQSGGPPPRVYVPLLHRYVTPELADTIYGVEPAIVRNVCDGCEDMMPSDVNYHKMMEHSVICRQREYDEWSVLSPGDALARLEEDAKKARSLVATVTDRLPAISPLSAAMRVAAQHFDQWIPGLRAAIASRR